MDWSGKETDVNMNMVRCGSPPNKSVLDCPNVGDDGGGSNQNGCFACGTCDSRFKSDHMLWFHIRVHIPRHKRCLCPFCPFVSMEIPSLEKHLKANHLSRIVCNVCRYYVATSRADLSRHVFRDHIRNRGGGGCPFSSQGRGALMSENRRERCRLS